MWLLAHCADLLTGGRNGREKQLTVDYDQLVVSRCQKTAAKLTLRATTRIRNFCRLYQSCNAQSTTPSLAFVTYLSSHSTGEDNCEYECRTDLTGVFLSVFTCKVFYLSSYLLGPSTVIQFHSKFFFNLLL